MTYFKQKRKDLVFDGDELLTYQSNWMKNYPMITQNIGHKRNRTIKHNNMLIMFNWDLVNLF